MSVTELAKILGISRGYLSTTFKDKKIRLKDFKNIEVAESWCRANITKCQVKIKEIDVHDLEVKIEEYESVEEKILSEILIIYNETYAYARKALVSMEPNLIGKSNHTYTETCKQVNLVRNQIITTQELEKELIPIDDLMKFLYLQLKLVLDQFNNLNEIAKECNPEDPDLAGEILDAYADNAIAVIRKRYEKIIHELDNEKK